MQQPVLPSSGPVEGSCRNGHPWSTTARWSPRGGRYCVECARLRQQRRRHAHPAQAPPVVPPAPPDLLTAVGAFLAHGAPIYSDFARTGCLYCNTDFHLLLTQGHASTCLWAHLRDTYKALHPA
jgi:hypothetical protein